MASKRLEKIKKVTLTRPYIFYFIFIVIAFLIVNYYANQLYVTASTLFTYNLAIIIPYLIFTVFIALLIGININLIILKFKEIKAVNNQSGITALGVFGGLLGGACPGCFVGVFPAFLGLFGITATLSSLPLFGLEIEMASVALLVVSTVLLTRDNVCKIKKK